MYVRIELISACRISAKSTATSEGSGNSYPLLFGGKEPYVTPFMRNFLSPTIKNFPTVLAFSIPAYSPRDKRGSSCSRNRGLGFGIRADNQPFYRERSMGFPGRFCWSDSDDISTSVLTVFQFRVVAWTESSFSKVALESLVPPYPLGQ